MFFASGSISRLGVGLLSPFRELTFDEAISSRRYAQVTSEVFILNPLYKIRLLFHQKAKPVVCRLLAHRLPLFADQIVFLKNFCPLPLERRPVLVYMDELFKAYRMDDAKFQGFYRFYSLAPGGRKLLNETKISPSRISQVVISRPRLYR